METFKSTVSNLLASHLLQRKCYPGDYNQIDNPNFNWPFLQLENF